MRKFITAILIFFFSILLSTCSDSPKKDISVVNLNMYTGFDAEARFAEFEGGADPIEVAKGIISDFNKTMPADRMRLVAKEIVELRPDFIGLQEVTYFSVYPLFKADFLELLMKDIKEEGGPDYNYIVIDNLVLDDTVDIGTGQLVSVTYKDREAILYRDDFEIEGEVIKRQLASHRDPFNYEGQDIVFYRGLIGARFKNGNEQPITFFSTHLDQAYLGDIQKDQMQEILDTLVTYAEDPNLVLVGDFNSQKGDETYELAPAWGFEDTFALLHPDDPGLTCCNLGDLSNTDPMPSQRIDVIFSKSSQWEPLESRIVFNTRNDIWPSDHFGVFTLFGRIEEQAAQ
jgi:endonuclease/exonuclease/phosphatase family metal-dependent hydrolase